MNNNKVLYGIIGAVLALAIVALGVYVYQQRRNETATKDTDTSKVTPDDTSTKGTEDNEKPVNSTSFKSEKGVAIALASPERGSTVTSPLSVTGSVPGTWSFEGQFTVRLLDSNSTILAEAPAKLNGDWMSENQVPFSATLTYTAPPAGSMGLLVLQKANPSDLQDNADSLTVPVQF